MALRDLQLWYTMITVGNHEYYYNFTHFENRFDMQQERITFTVPAILVQCMWWFSVLRRFALQPNMLACSRDSWNGWNRT